MSTNSLPPSFTVPEGFSLHSENSAHILLPNDNGAFLNPVQEFNRDLSVACIRTWGNQLNEARKRKWETTQARKAKKDEQAGGQAKKQRTEESTQTSEDAESLQKGSSSVQDVKDAEVPSGDLSAPLKESTAYKPEPKPHKFVILEALSATGLRSIRYAKEIPLVKHVIANDLSPTAAEAMRRNVEINGLGPEPASESIQNSTDDYKAKPRLGKVIVNEGDACTLMYNHRSPQDRVDVVDLDPYGTAAPFIDAAVQCVSENGLLCVTCTDLSVLATTNYSEKCFSNYGGIPVKAEYCHEAALRLVLRTISTSAARYGRYIHPLLSLSIDFYVRIFVRVASSPLEVKKIASKTSTYYVCSSCQSFYDQPLGRVLTTVHETSGNVNYNYKVHAGPPVTDRCPECHSALHVAGPMWSGPIHDKEFVERVLEHVEASETNYGTALRMKGMLTVAKEELDAPFYFTPSKVSSFFHCVCPSLDDTASALLHAGHAVSRSHACPGSLKTTASRSAIHDIFRSWIKNNPVKMDKIGEASPARVLLAKEPEREANFKHHPMSITRSSKIKIVRYQQNPLPNWGPGTKGTANGAGAGGKKRKRDGDGDGEVGQQ